MIFGKWVRSLAGQAALDAILDRQNANYSFVLLDMFKNNFDTWAVGFDCGETRWLELFERYLNLPLDDRLSPESWASRVAVRIPADLPIGLLEYSLEYCVYLGVNSIILAGALRSDFLWLISEYVAKRHSQISFLFECTCEDLNRWSITWRSDKNFFCHVKAALKIRDEENQNHLIERWRSEALGLVMCDRQPSEMVLSWSVPIVNVGASKFQMPSERKPHVTELYDDVLQTPLRPLSDNLPSSSYAAFESDPVKYQKYGEAIRKALEDLSTKDRLSVAVLGAGRGPLVEILLKALAQSQRTPTTKVYVLDKNPHAFVTLWRRKKSLPAWKDVELVLGDMREWTPDGPIDLIITELLGSFGDNELSPECLDAVQKHLSQPDGIIIPQSYTSWIEPIHAPRLYRKVLLEAERDPLAFDKTYVCAIKDARYPAAESKPFLTFCHPRDPAVDVNTSLTIPFHIDKESCYLDGFVGYFSAVLYGDVSISTRRSESTPGMFSWFPLFLSVSPLPHMEPLRLEKGSELILEISRCVEDDKVQYRRIVKYKNNSL